MPQVIACTCMCICMYCTVQYMCMPWYHLMTLDYFQPTTAAVIFSNSQSSSSSGRGSKGEGGGGGGGGYVSDGSAASMGHPGRASRVVSGLVRLGGKLGRPRELPVSRHLSIQSPPTPPANTGREHCLTLVWIMSSVVSSWGCLTQAPNFFAFHLSFSVLRPDVLCSEMIVYCTYEQKNR